MTEPFPVPRLGPIFTVDISDVPMYLRRLECCDCGNDGKWGGCKGPYGCGRKRVVAAESIRLGELAEAAQGDGAGEP